METSSDNKKKKRPIRKVVLWVLAGIFVILSAVGIYVTHNFNQLLTDALIKNFNSTLISDVYELKFEKLRVNLLQGNIKVFKVVLQPRQKPLHSYPYINSSFKLSTNKILLTNVRILDLLKSNILQLDKIEITEPDVELKIEDQIPIFFPFKDSTNQTKQVNKDKKNPIELFVLQKFDLSNASLHLVNLAKEREIKVKGFSISIRDLIIEQLPGKDLVSYNHIEVSIGNLTGTMKNEALKYLSFKDYTLTLDTLTVEKSVDTLIYNFADFSTGIKMVDIQTSDSIYHIGLQSLQLSYKDKTVKVNGFSFMPNVSHAVLQAKSRYQKTEFSVGLGSLNITGLDFDSLIRARKIFIEEIKLDSINLSLYKDKTKPLDKNKFPEYLSQKLVSIPLPINVKLVSATNFNLVNVERKEDGKTAKVTVGRGTLAIKNITNQSPSSMLTLNASAFLQDKVLLNLLVNYSYNKPQFSYILRSGKFNLLDLNQLIVAYVPAKISNGTVDEILLSGTAYRNHASGTMKFLYHDLKVDMSISDTKWQNDVVAFAANTVVNSNNPPSDGLPPKVVAFKADRDMNKGGFNMLLKSFFAGMKETIIMSKENKKAYKEEKKKKEQQDGKPKKKLFGKNK
jgi:hypothetical protein